MARINKGILGGFSGKVGTVVGANFRGAYIIRSLPTKGAKLPTEAQSVRRQLFSAVCKFLQPVNTVVSVYFGQAAGTQSRRNLAMSYTLTDAATYDNGQATILYNKVLLTKGELAGFQNLQVDVSGGTVAYTWEDNSAQGNANSDDIFCSAVCCELLNLWDVQESSTRQSGGANIVPPASMVGKALQVYAFFRNANATAACTSSFLGQKTLS